MFFSKIRDPELQRAIRGLTRDQVFQDIFGHDHILDELEAEKDALKNVFPEICAVADLPIIINEKSYSHVKLFPYCYLWATENPLVRESKREVTELDLDIFFYLLDNEVKNDVITTMTRATGEIKRRGLTLDDAHSIARTLISLAFLPLKMFPQSQATEQLVGKQETSFDADFMTSIISKVHQVTGCSPHDIMHKLSLNSCCYFYIQWAREQGAKGIERRPDEEILKSIDHRACVLVAERLIELGKLSPDKKDEFVALVSTPPEK